MAKLDRIENGTDYNQFSTNELYLRQAAILDEKDETKVRLDSDEKIDAVTKVMEDLDLKVSSDKDGQYIPLSDLVALNEVLEKEKFTNQNQYDDNSVDVIIESLIDKTVQDTKSEKNTIYGQDSLTDGQKTRAEEFLGEGAENIKNIYLSTAEMLVDAGYWDSSTMNERLNDIMNGDRLIGESYGVMMDALSNYGIADENHNIIKDWYDEEKGVTAYEAQNAELLEENQNWLNSPEALIQDDLLTEITKLLYGEDEGSKDDAIKDDSSIIVTDINGDEVEITLKELLSEENLENLPQNILENLKTSLEESINSAGKVTLSELDTSVMNEIYQYNSLIPTIETIVADDEYYQSYLDALKNGSMTPEELVSAINDTDPDLLKSVTAKNEDTDGVEYTNDEESVEATATDIYTNISSILNETQSDLDMLSGDNYNKKLDSALQNIEDALNSINDIEDENIRAEVLQNVISQLGSSGLEQITKFMDTVTKDNWIRADEKAGDDHKEIMEMLTTVDFNHPDNLKMLKEFYSDKDDNFWGKESFTDSLYTVDDKDIDTLGQLSIDAKRDLLQSLFNDDLFSSHAGFDSEQKALFKAIIMPNANYAQSFLDSKTLIDEYKASHDETENNYMLSFEIFEHQDILNNLSVDQMTGILQQYMDQNNCDFETAKKWMEQYILDIYQYDGGEEIARETNAMFTLTEC